MPVTETFVGVAVDGAGKLIDNTSGATAAGTVLRQSVALGDPVDFTQRAAVIARALQVTETRTDLFEQMLSELQQIRLLLELGFNIDVKAEDPK